MPYLLFNGKTIQVNAYLYSIKVPDPDPGNPQFAGDAQYVWQTSWTHSIKINKNCSAALREQLSDASVTLSSQMPGEVTVGP